MNRTSAILLTAAIVVVLALLAAAVAGKLARLDGASHPAALMRGASAFAAVLTLAVGAIGTLAPFLT
ncbi:hypothetical protein [Kitasatospora sp. NBC_01539]|uniref:hypothetical protein n=1 Tax=Kitasatospora sp. NBC_01539 TaxID=2903577 RepID=UPI003860192D